MVSIYDPVRDVYATLLVMLLIFMGCNAFLDFGLLCPVGFSQQSEP